MASGTIPNIGRGSGTNGEYIQLADGTIIQWGRISVTVPANSYAEYTLTYPKSFGSGIPSLSLLPEQWTDPKQVSCILRGYSQVNPVIRIGTTATVDSSIAVNWIAIGKA